LSGAFRPRLEERDFFKHLEFLSRNKDRYGHQWKERAGVPERDAVAVTGNMEKGQKLPEGMKGSFLFLDRVGNDLYN
jgi:hypothetical protein